MRAGCGFVLLVALLGCGGSGGDDGGGAGAAAGGATDPAAGASSPGGVSGTNGASGTHGSAGTGSAGNAGGAGSGGTGSSAVAVSVGVGASDADQVARAAAVVGACLGDDGANRNAAHIWYGASNARIWGRFGLQLECLATARGGCDAVMECLGWSVSATTEVCEASCDGDVFSYCGDGYRQQVDCGTLGLRCDPAAFCVEGDATACDRDTFVNSCEGLLPVLCDDGAVHRGPDCDALGLDCEAGSCIGRGEACAGGSQSYQGDVFYDGIECDGAVLVSCVDGREHRLDCASIAPGFGCHTVAGEAFCGLADECVPAAPAGGSGPEESCEGSTLLFCNAGRVERIDCVQLGFEGCRADGDLGCVPGLVP